MNSSQDQREASISFVELFALVKRHLVLIILAGLLSGMLTYCCCSFLVNPVYKASAKMIVNAKVDQSGNITNDQITSSQKLVDTCAIIIRSQTVLNPVIDKLGLDMDVETLQNKVSVTSLDATQVMEIAVESTDPVMAVKIVEEILIVAPEIIIDAVEAGSVKTVEPAYLQSKPVSPRTNLYTVVTAFLFMFLTTAVPVIRSVMDNTFKSDIDLYNDLGLPVLGVIPEYESCQNQKPRK